MINKEAVVFNANNRKLIFGTYDGEGEDIDRLKQYYFKNDIFEELISEQPIRILVGNKGVGKSAMFRIAFSEAKDKGLMPITLLPDDVAEIWEKNENVILTSRRWKFQLINSICQKVLQQFGLFDDALSSTILPLGHKIFAILNKSINKAKRNAELSPEEKSNIVTFLSSKKLIVYLDDLDKGWTNRKEGVTIIAALTSAIRDLSRDNPGLTFKLALRLDVFRAIRKFDESGDKWEESVINLSYKIHDIFVFLIKRILTFYGEPFDDLTISKSQQSVLGRNLIPIFEPTFRGQGKWSNIEMRTALTTLIRNRPRDLVKLCVAAAKEAYKNDSTTIMTEHIVAILPTYSESIIDDTIGEYISELPSISKLLYAMRPTKKEKTAEDSYRFTTQQLHDKLFKITQNLTLNFASGLQVDPHTLKEFLYKINFITARRTLATGEIVRSSYEENQKLSVAYVDEGNDWEIHPAYRWALQTDSLENLFNKIAIQ